jgi:hypothetical protein
MANSSWVEGFQLEQLDPKRKQFKYIQGKIKKTNGGKDFDIKQVKALGLSFKNHILFLKNSLSF